MPAFARDYIPNIRPLASHTRQKDVQWDVTGLPAAVILYQWADRFKMDAETGKKTQQGRFHHRTPMRDVVFDAHAHKRFNQTQGKMGQYSSLLIDGHFSGIVRIAVHIRAVSHPAAEFFGNAESRYFGHLSHWEVDAVSKQRVFTDTLKYEALVQVVLQGEH